MVKRDELGRFTKECVGEENIFYGKHHKEKTKIEHGKVIKEKWKNPKYRENQIEKAKGQHRSPETEFKKGIIPWSKTQKGIHLSPQSEFKKGHKTWNIGLTKENCEIIRKLSEGQKGEKNPNWQGGVSFEPYTKEFNNKFKRAIRKRDNQICMLCGIHREKLSRSLNVHHINYDKEMSIPQNCVSLCLKCHIKTNKNRDLWTKFFQSLLSEKYGYEYSENQEIIIKQKNLVKFI